MSPEDIFKDGYRYGFDHGLSAGHDFGGGYRQKDPDGAWEGSESQHFTYGRGVAVDARSNTGESQPSQPLSGTDGGSKPDTEGLPRQDEASLSLSAYVQAVARFHVQMIAESNAASKSEHVESMRRLAALWEDVQEASKARIPAWKRQCGECGHTWEGTPGVELCGDCRVRHERHQRALQTIAERIESGRELIDAIFHEGNYILGSRHASAAPVGA